MAKNKYFVTQQTFLNLNDQSLERFLNKLVEFHEFLLEQKDYWDTCIVINQDDLTLLTSDYIYLQKRVLGSFLDAKGAIKKVSNAAANRNFIYYQIISGNGSGNFNLIDCESAIEAFENELLNPSSCHIISDSHGYLSLCKIHKFDRNIKPLLENLQSVNYADLELETFFKSFIKPLFKEDDSGYKSFKDQYTNFFTTFDWNRWTPSSNFIPAHTLLAPLGKLHKLIKEDSYLIDWGYILAFLNGGRFNNALTKENSSKKTVNNIFQLGINKGKNTIFFSTDLESGTLEIYNYAGKHLNRIYGLHLGVIKQNRNYTIEVPESKWH